jgi:hypothetical protein
MSDGTWCGVCQGPYTDDCDEHTQEEINDSIDEAEPGDETPGWREGVNGPATSIMEELFGKGRVIVIDL